MFLRLYNPQQVVGDFFEDRVSKILNLRRIDINAEGNVPDLASKDGSFYVEVKASAFSNGGVIKKK